MRGEIDFDRMGELVETIHTLAADHAARDRTPLEKALREAASAGARALEFQAELDKTQAQLAAGDFLEREADSGRQSEPIESVPKTSGASGETPEARAARLAKQQAAERTRQEQEAAELARQHAEREAGKKRQADELARRRSHWTRERQAREKYAERREEMAAAHWVSDEKMSMAYKSDFDLEQGMIRVVDGKRSTIVTDEERQWRAEAEAVHDLLYEFAGKRGVDFGHGVPQPAWRIGRDVFLGHARTVAQDAEGERVRVAFPRVAGAPELVHDREQQRWDYKHPDPQHSYWMKAENAPDWESAAGIAHYASVQDALKRGDPVPGKAAADYPDLAPKPQPVPEKKQATVEKAKPPPTRQKGRGGGGMEM